MCTTLVKAAWLLARKQQLLERLQEDPGPQADINCRDRDVRSLAEPEPDRQVFAKFKHLLRKAVARSAETNCITIGEILGAFTPTECANYFRNSAYAQS